MINNKALNYRVVLVPNETPYDSFQEHINRYAFAKNFVKGKKVLDIACGTGYGASYLAKQSVEKIFAGDIESAYLRFAVDNYTNLKGKVVKLNGEYLPFKDNAFDVVTSFETVEHVNNPSLLLEEFNRVLNYQGTLICSTPNRIIFSPHYQKEGWSCPSHTYEFTTDEFITLIKKQFNICRIYVQRYVGIHTRLINEIRYLRRRLSASFEFFNNYWKLVGDILFPWRWKPKAPIIAKLGMDINEQIIDNKFSVKQYKKHLIKTPGIIIVVAKPLRY